MEDYINYWSQSRGMQVYMPERFFYVDVETKEHPLQASLDRQGRLGMRKVLLHAANFVKDYEIPFLSKLIKSEFPIDLDRITIWGNEWRDIIEMKEPK